MLHVLGVAFQIPCLLWSAMATMSWRGWQFRLLLLSVSACLLMQRGMILLYACTGVGNDTRWTSTHTGIQQLYRSKA